MSLKADSGAGITFLGVRLADLWRFDFRDQYMKQPERVLWLVSTCSSRRGYVECNGSTCCRKSDWAP